MVDTEYSSHLMADKAKVQCGPLARVVRVIGGRARKDETAECQSTFPKLRCIGDL